MKFTKVFIVIITASCFSLSLQAEEQNLAPSGDLKTIMNGLLDDTKLLTEGIFLEDFSKIELAANNIANHPSIKIESKKKIVATLGKEMSFFKGFDILVHDSAVDIAKSTTTKDMTKIISNYHKLIDGCQSCHSQFKNRVSELLNQNIEETKSSKSND